MGQTIAVSGNYVHVVYSDNITGIQSIWYRRSSTGGATWDNDTPMELSPNPIPGAGSGDSFPLLAVSGASVHVVWERNRQPNNQPVNTGLSMYRKSDDNGKTWNSEINLGLATFWPGIAVSGNWVYVTLNAHDSNGFSQVYMTRSSKNGAPDSFTTPLQTLTTGTGRCEDPSMSAFGSNVFILWNDSRLQQGTNHLNVFFRSSFNNGQNWGTETPVTSAPHRSYTPMIFASSDTNLAIAYGDIPAGTGLYQAFSQTSTNNGQAWDNLYDHSLVTDTSNDVYPNIVQDGENVHIFYSTTPSGSTFSTSPLVYALSKDGGATFSIPPLQLATGAQPFLALSGTAVHAIYVDHSQGNGQVYYLQNPTGNPGGTAGTSPSPNPSPNPGSSPSPSTPGSPPSPSPGGPPSSPPSTKFHPTFLKYDNKTQGTLAGFPIHFSTSPSSTTSHLIQLRFNKIPAYKFGLNSALHSVLQIKGSTHAAETTISFPNLASSLSSKQLFMYTKSWGVGTYGFTLKPVIHSHNGAKTKVEANGSSWTLTVSSTSPVSFSGILSFTLSADTTHLRFSKKTKSNIDFTLAVSAA